MLLAALLTDRPPVRLSSCVSPTNSQRWDDGSRAASQNVVMLFLDSIEPDTGAVPGAITTTHWHGEAVAVVDE